MGLRGRKLGRARLAGRRRVAMAAVGVLAGALAVAPAPSGAAPAQPGPVITVTEITAPEGVAIVTHNSEITNRGSALVETEIGSEERPAIWRRGSLTPLASPVEPADWDDTEIEDMSERAQVVGTQITCSDMSPGRQCTTPYLWTDGEPRAIPTGGLNGAGVAVNDRGQVLVMRSPHVPAGQPYPDRFEMTLVWQDGRTFVPPPVDDAVWHQPMDINDRGQVALAVTPFEQPDQTHAGIWQVGDERGVIDLGTLPGFDSRPSVVNDRGHIAGIAKGPDDVEHAVLWRRGEVVDLGRLYGYSEVEAINDRDEVLVQQGTADGERAFLWREGRTIDLGTLGGARAYGYALNDHGQVVGFSHTDDPARSRAFLWQDGRMIDLGALVDPHTYSYAYDINDRGQIVGEVGGRPVIWTIRSR